MKKIVSLMFLLLALWSCGKASQPIPVKDSGYPHSYPRH